MPAPLGATPSSKSDHDWLDLPKMPTYIGDWIDPAGAVEVIHHRWYFCKAMERVATDVLDELFSLDHLMPPRDESSHIAPEIKAWCDRWDIKPAWLLDAAIGTLAWRYTLQQRIKAPLPRLFFPWPFGADIPSELMTRVLEDSNPGWTDTIYHFVVPELPFSWHPTQQTKRVTREHVRKQLDEFLDAAFADAEHQLRESGSRPATKGQAGTVKFEHYIWAVQHYIHKHKISEIARRYEREPAFEASRGKVRRAVENLDKFLGLSGGQNAATGSVHVQGAKSSLL